MPKQQAAPRSSVKIITVPSLSAEEYARRRKQAGVTRYQITQLTDISKERQARIESGVPSSLVLDKTLNEYRVPNFLVVVLLCLENGFLTISDESMPIE